MHSHFSTLRRCE